MKNFSVFLLSKSYQHLLKPIFFQFNPEKVHNGMTFLGEWLGSKSYIKKIIKKTLVKKNPHLEQNILGVNFASPLGLSAGFDYEARLTQITPSLGFGFHSVGTITNLSYGGNPRPMLGRLPKSKSLMVNKGFKNDGALATASRLQKLNFEIPVGVSIGRTNTDKLNQQESVADIIQALEIFEKSGVKNSYYEINISCPNLIGNVNFYSKDNLDDLLTAVDKLEIKKPIFIKMPISNSDPEIEVMLEVIAKHCPKGVIFGNLQKDRKHPALDPVEVAKFKVGNFSGKPTYDRSNELISLAYKKYKDRLVIIGCGGVFNAADAYTKIKKGASLVQLITGMIYQGPQLLSEINSGLVELLEKDGFNNISEAVGTKSKVH